MAVAAFLSDTHVEVTPGEEATCDIKVRNTGQVVDQFDLQLLGDTEEWAVVEPPLINLLPGDESSARIIFRPPRSPDAPAGVQAFGVRVRSREDPHGSTVVEGGVEIAGFTEIAIELVPPKGRGRRKAKYKLVVDNNGNQPCPVAIAATDPEDALEIVVEHPALNTEPGTATVVRTRTIPHKRFLRGQPKTHGFQLIALPDDADPITADGVMTQEQLLPKWLLPVVALAVLAIGGLIALWFMLLKPTVQSAAKEDASAQIRAASAAASQAATAAEQAGESAESANADAAAAAAAADLANRGTPTKFRLAGETEPVTDDSFAEFTYIAPDQQVLAITDIILQNPRGDFGYMRVILDGQVELEVGLANIRDLDYHYVQPLVVPPNKPVVVAVNCTTPGTAEVDRCTPAVSFSGRLRT